MTTPQIYYKNGSSWQSAILNSYPVGAIYSSISSTSPASLFGGSWAEITGAVLRANKQAGVYSDSDTHTLTIGEMPKHTHGLHVDTWASSFGGGGVAITNGSADYWSEDTSKGEPIGFKGGGGLIQTSSVPLMFICGEELHKFGCDA